MPSLFKELKFNLKKNIFKRLSLIENRSSLIKKMSSLTFKKSSLI